MTTLSSILPPISLASATGTLPVGNGGTGVTTSTGAGSVVLSNGPSITLANATGLPLTTGVTGTLPVANGGTGAPTLTGVVKGNGTSAFTAGTVSLTTEVSGTLPVASGGTGAVTLTGVVKGTGTSALTAGAVSLTAEVSGTLPVANGGTGAATLTANAVLIGNGTSAVTAVAPGTTGNVLTSNGTTWTSAAAVSGTQQFTSSGSITAGQAVSLNSNGTVSTTTGVSQTATFVPDTTFSATNGYADYSFGSFYDSSTGWHFAGIGLGSSGNEAVYLSSYKVSSAGAITNLNIVFIATNSSFLYQRGSVFKDTTSGAIMIALCNGAYGSNLLTAVTFNTSTGAMTTAGTAFAGVPGSAKAALDGYFDTFSNRTVLVTTNDSGGGSVRAFSYTIGVGFSQTATGSFSTAGGSTNAMAAAFNTNTNTGRVFYRAGAGGLATLTVSINAAGNTITIVDAGTIVGETFGGFARAAYFPSINRFLLQSSMQSSAVSRLIDPNTGYQVTNTTTVPSSNIYYAWENYGFANSYDTVNNVAYCAGTDSGGGTGLYTWTYTLTASSIAYTNGANLSGSGYSRGTSYVYDSTLARGGITTRNSTTTIPLTIGVLPAAFSTTADKFIGFSTQSVSTGAAVTVTTLGGVNTNQSALTTGLAYYLQVTGALSTTPSAYGIVARALSATSVQVTTGGAFKKLISQTVISGSPSNVALTLPSGYTQFEITFQNVRGDTASPPVLTGFNSSSSAVSVLGRGQAFLPSSSVSSYTQSANLLALTGGQNHSANQIFGGSLLLQSTATASNIWSYTLMTSFYIGGDAYFSSTGYFSGLPVTAILSNIGTLTNGGVVTLYGIG